MPFSTLRNRSCLKNWWRLWSNKKTSDTSEIFFALFAVSRNRHVSMHLLIIWNALIRSAQPFYPVNLTNFSRVSSHPSMFVLQTLRLHLIFVFLDSLHYCYALQSTSSFSASLLIERNRFEIWNSKSWFQIRISHPRWTYSKVQSKQPKVLK